MQKIWIFLPAALLMIMAGTPFVLAQSGGDYEMTWSSINTGSMILTGGDYSLEGTIGQPEPGATQRGGDYTLTGGVVDAGQMDVTPAAGERVFLPLILNH